MLNVGYKNEYDFIEKLNNKKFYELEFLLQDLVLYLFSNIKSTAVHFSRLTYQPLSRSLEHKENMAYMREWIQVKWYNMENSIIEIIGNRTQTIE